MKFPSEEENGIWKVVRISHGCLLKAFDLIDHHLLLSKLKVLGVNESFLPLFGGYLSRRRQYGNIGGYHSIRRPVTLEALQGSNVGPISFLYLSMICLKHNSTVSLIYMRTTLQSATLHTIKRPPIPYRRAYRGTLVK